MRLLLAVAFCCLTHQANAARLDEPLESAAISGVALLICDISSGAGSHGWNDAIRRGAENLNISEQAAREITEARQREIQTYLNRHRKLDDFCSNYAAHR